MFHFQNMVKIWMFPGKILKHKSGIQMYIDQS